MAEGGKREEGPWNEKKALNQPGEREVEEEPAGSGDRGSADR
jgi:hypothetical protein